MPKALVQRILEKPRYSIWERAYIQPSHNLFRQVVETSCVPTLVINEQVNSGLLWMMREAQSTDQLRIDLIGGR